MSALVASRGATQPPRVTLQLATIDLRIGDQKNGEMYELDRITSGILPTSSGGILVPQEKEAAFREFDDRGRFVRTLGRRGGGPGEFQTINALGSWSDTIWVTDNSARRITIFAPNGSTFSTPIAAVPPSTTPVGPTRHGAMLFRALPSNQDFLNGVRAAPNVLQDTKSKSTLLTRTLPSGTTAMMIQTANGRSSTRNALITRAFSQDGLVQLSSDGQCIVMIDRHVSTDAPDLLPVDVYDTRGQKKASFQIRRNPIKVDERFFNERLNAWAGTMAKVRSDVFSTTAAAREYMDKHLNLPATYPLAGGLLVENENAIWIAEPYGATALLDLSTLAKDPGIVWERYNLEGVLQQRVRIPSAVELKAVRNGLFWGTADGVDEVQVVVRLKVTR